MSPFLATPSKLAISNQRKHSSQAKQMMSHPFEAKKMTPWLLSKCNQGETYLEMGVGPLEPKSRMKTWHNQEL